MGSTALGPSKPCSPAVINRTSAFVAGRQVRCGRRCDEWHRTAATAPTASNLLRMSDARTRAEVKAAASAQAASESESGVAPAAQRDWQAAVRRAWPVAAMALALLLWWPAGFSGRADWMHLPLAQVAGGVAPATGGVLLLGSLVAAAVVSALVGSPWPKFGIAAGLTALAWVLSSGDATFAPGERAVLAALAGVGMLLGLAVGARSAGGAVSIGAFLALLAGLSPATWSRGPLLAVAVALPFWAATSDRVAPTVLAVVRVVLTWLVAVVLSTSLWAGFGALTEGALAEPVAAARVVGSGFVDHVRAHALETVRAAPQVYTSWIWVAGALAVALVLVAALLRRRRAAS